MSGGRGGGYLIRAQHSPNIALLGAMAPKNFQPRPQRSTQPNARLGAIDMGPPHKLQPNSRPLEFNQPGNPGTTLTRLASCPQQKCPRGDHHHEQQRHLTLDLPAQGHQHLLAWPTPTADVPGSQLARAHLPKRPGTNGPKPENQKLKRSIRFTEGPNTSWVQGKHYPHAASPFVGKFELLGQTNAGVRSTCPAYSRFYACTIA